MYSITSVICFRVFIVYFCFCSHLCQPQHCSSLIFSIPELKKYAVNDRSTGDSLLVSPTGDNRKCIS